jgi:outer membrane immunogenic protein
LHGGYAFGETDASPIDDGLSPVDADGFFGGGQIGYNIQSGMWVFGVEADAAWTGLENDVTAGSCLAGVVACEYVEMEWLATVRGRVGYAADRVLLYVTGGLAIAGLNATDFDAGPGSASNTHTGYAVGGGGEYGFTNNISAKLEYLYIDLSDETYNLGTPDSVDFSGHFIKAGINYRF